MAKRWRPRFSVRTLAIVVTLFCAYFGAWGVTTSYGVDAVVQHVVPWDGGDTKSPAPFFVMLDEYRPEDITEEFKDGYYCPAMRVRTHYIWFFGLIWKTPVHWEYWPRD